LIPHIAIKEQCCAENVVILTVSVKMSLTVDVKDKTFKQLGEDGFRLLTERINNVYENGEWLKDFTEVTMIGLKKKEPKATKCSDHCTVSLIAHIAKIVARRRIERKIEDVLEEDEFEFGRGNGTSGAICILTIISGRTLTYKTNCVLVS
jgi:hypothetical protein